MNQNDPWIQTYTGVQFPILSCEAKHIVPEDIAHSLSMVCRFNGHTEEFYSVAQHCIHVAELVPEEDKLVALLHDAAEAYLFDAVSPVKTAIGVGYRIVERIIWRAVCEKFSLPFKEGYGGTRIVLPDSVKEADLKMLVTEKTYLMKDFGYTWGEPIDSTPPLIRGLCPLPRWSAKSDFLNMLHKLWPEHVRRLKDG